MAEDNDDMAAMLAELRLKGVKANTLKTLSVDWGVVCDEGAHPDLASAARADTLMAQRKFRRPDQE